MRRPLASPVPRIAVAFLYTADQLFDIAADPREVVVSQLSPLRFCSALKLLPLTFEHIGIHGCVLSDKGLCNPRAQLGGSTAVVPIHLARRQDGGMTLTEWTMRSPSALGEARSGIARELRLATCIPRRLRPSLCTEVT